MLYLVFWELIAEEESWRGEEVSDTLLD